MKTNQLLAGAFLILLIPTLIKLFSGGVEYLEERPKLFDGLVADNVAAIELKKPKEEAGQIKIGKDGQPEIERIVFARKEKDWLVASGPFAGHIKARGSDIESRILEPIGKIEASASTIIVEDAKDDALKDYKLDEKGATTLRLIDANDKEVATLLIGRPAGGVDAGSNATSGTYVRRPNQKIVVLATDDFSLDATEDYWADKSIQDIDEAEIVGLRLSNEHGEIAFKREENKEWQVEKGPEGVGDLRKDEVTSLLSRARSIVVQDFLLPQEHPKHGVLQAPKIQVRVTTKDQKEHKLSIGNQVEGKQQYYGHLSGKQLLFSLADWDVTPFQKQPKEFFDPKKEEPKDGAPKEEGKKTGEKAGAPKKTADKDPAAKDGGKAKSPDEKTPDPKKTPVEKTPVKKTPGKAPGKK